MTLFQAPLGSPQIELTKVQQTTALATIRASETNGSQVVAKIHICNKSAGTALVDLEVSDGTTFWSIEYQRSLPVGTSFEMRDYVLPRGYSLQCKTSSQPVHTSVIYSLIERD